jgi:peptidoglycan/LPS O-acetylase OafA/YrhL
MVPESNSYPLKSQKHYPIVDALRIILAFWVTMGHLGVTPLFFWMDSTTKIGRFAIHGLNFTVFGTPAVIGFFVISGFCIHLPFRHGEELPIGRYYVRRYVRILVPVVVGLFIYRIAGNRQPLIGKDSILWTSILWSLVCEEIYYAIYPLTRVCRRRFGWNAILPVTFFLAVATAATRPHALNWTAYGPFETALILFPVWLLGCVLAEESDRLPAITSAWIIWKWRILVWAGSMTCEFLHFKVGIPFTQTMLWFGILAYFWVKREIAYSAHRRPYRMLAWAGLWSYSLYLMHLPLVAIFGKLWPSHLPYVAGWFASYTFVMGFSYLFYLAVEKPSHKLARKLGAVRKREPDTRQGSVAKSFEEEYVRGNLEDSNLPEKKDSVA